MGSKSDDIFPWLIDRRLVFIGTDELAWLRIGLGVAVNDVTGL
jgi:hypothetical protein